MKRAAIVCILFLCNNAYANVKQVFMNAVAKEIDHIVKTKSKNPDRAKKMAKACYQRFPGEAQKYDLDFDEDDKLNTKAGNMTFDEAIAWCKNFDATTAGGGCLIAAMVLYGEGVRGKWASHKLVAPSSMVTNFNKAGGAPFQSRACAKDKPALHKDVARYKGIVQKSCGKGAEIFGDGKGFHVKRKNALRSVRTAKVFCMKSK